MSPHNLNVCVTGNMASGKTTFARLLAAHLANACFVPEPVEANPFLAHYFMDQQRWGFTAQLRYFADYVRSYEDAINGQDYRYHVIDAGTWTNQAVYAKYLFDQHIMSDDEYAFYLRLCDDILRGHAIPEPDAFIFIDAAPLTCWQRMHKRGWPDQVAAVELDYIQTLDRYFQRMKQDIITKNIPALTLSSESIDYGTAAGQLEALDCTERFLDAHQLTNPR
jgi:deoxyadenosine/deoxycytidine kinase